VAVQCHKPPMWHSAAWRRNPALRRLISTTFTSANPPPGSTRSRVNETVKWKIARLHCILLHYDTLWSNEVVTSGGAGKFKIVVAAANFHSSPCRDLHCTVVQHHTKRALVAAIVSAVR
jgi:hypothetical protein